MSFVYFIGCQNSGGEMRVKIGFTRRDPNMRLNDLQPCSPEELDVLAFIPGDASLERKLHETFAAVRLHNEWFLCSGLLERLVQRLMGAGGGALHVTQTDVFMDAFFETVYDWVPDPSKPEEDWMWLETSADCDAWDEDFSHRYDEAIARIRAAREAAE